MASLLVSTVLRLVTHRREPANRSVPPATACSPASTEISVAFSASGLICTRFPAAPLKMWARSCSAAMRPASSGRTPAASMRASVCWQVSRVCDSGIGFPKMAMRGACAPLWMTKSIGVQVPLGVTVDSDGRGVPCEPSRHSGPTITPAAPAACASASAASATHARTTIERALPFLENGASLPGNHQRRSPVSTAPSAQDIRSRLLAQPVGEQEHGKQHDVRRFANASLLEDPLQSSYSSVRGLALGSGRAGGDQTQPCRPHSLVCEPRQSIIAELPVRPSWAQR